MSIIALHPDQQTWAPELFALLGRVALGDPIEQDGGTYVPLLIEGGGAGPAVGSSGSPVDVELLEEALEAKHTRVDETSEHGHVPELRVEHRGEKPLLLLDGEQVVGGKQNRIFNTSFIVLPGTSTVVPVSCVEQGRWGRRGDFTASRQTLHAAARVKKLRRVRDGAESTGRYTSHQGEVWNDVSEFLRTTRTMSPTDAFDEGTHSRVREKQRSLRRLEPVGGQVGLAMVRNRKLVSLDLFGSPELFARAWEKVARGLVIDEERAAKTEHDPDVAREVVTRALQALVTGSGKRQRPAPGCGETLHGGTDTLSVGAALHDGAVCHALIAG